MSDLVNTAEPAKRKINETGNRGSGETGSSQRSGSPVHRFSGSTAHPGFYQRHVMKVLKELRQGLIQVTLPQGTKMAWGDTTSTIRAEIRIKSPNFFKRCFLYGDIGFGESYTAGEWETDDLTALISWMILNVESHPTMTGSRRQKSPVNWLAALNRFIHRLRSNSMSGSRKNIEDHYDLSNEFFAQFLDSTMSYSCAVFETGNESLEEAQRLKFEKICQKLRLQPSDHVLEIGSGWGALAIHMARNYGCRVTTITISQKQLDYARRKIKEAGLEGRIDIRLQDYRTLTGRFDKLVSVEMLEAVGHEFLKPYFAKCHELLKPHGIVVLQVITCADHRYDQLRRSVDWIQKHIFPGSLLPSVGAIHRAVNATGDMILHDLENMTPHYVRTLSAWRDRFDDRQEKIRTLGFNEAFVRKWRYYFGYCEAAFAMRNINALQMVYTRPNNRLL